MNVYKAILLRPPLYRLLLECMKHKSFPKEIRVKSSQFLCIFSIYILLYFPPHLHIMQLLYIQYFHWRTSNKTQLFYTNYLTKYLCFLKYNFWDELHLFPRPHCTEVRFASFFSSGFITAIVGNPPERRLAKRTSVQWGKHLKRW